MGCPGYRSSGLRLPPELGLIEPNDPRFVSIIEVVEKELKHERYVIGSGG
jgi:GH15 family glucan-1,4-alpha-glucosidase